MSNLPSKVTYGRQEQGAALMAVLLILVLILIVGMIALRKSSTDLRVATADQMDNVLLQSSESANQKLEAIVNGPTTGSQSTLYKNIVLSSSGAFGYFIASNDNHNRGDEFVYCYNTNNNYLRSQATIFRQGGRMGGTDGFCEKNGDYTYATDRETVVTQMSIVLPDLSGEGNEDGRGFSHKVTPEGELKKESYEFDVYASSAIPSYGNPDGCFAKSSVPSANTPSPLLDCLNKAETPHKVIYQQAVVAKEARLSSR